MTQVAIIPLSAWRSRAVINQTPESTRAKTELERDRFGSIVGRAPSAPSLGRGMEMALVRVCKHGTAPEGSPCRRGPRDMSVAIRPVVDEWDARLITDVASAATS
jgi:hypothetical protein